MDDSFSSMIKHLFPKLLTTITSLNTPSSSVPSQLKVMTWAFNIQCRHTSQRSSSPPNETYNMPLKAFGEAIPCPWQHLPTYITNLYENWDTSYAHTFQVIQKYYKQFSEICVSDEVDNQLDHFMWKSSLNKYKERIREEASSHLQTLLKHVLKDGMPYLISHPIKGHLRTQNGK